MKVAINGFGRIGRVFFREAFKRGVNIVAINDVYGVKDAAYLLKYDSVYGPYDKKIVVQGNDLIIEGKRIKVVSEREPEKLPWKQLGANVIIESTGVFRDREGASKHLRAGADHVIVTAPCSDKPDITVVPGVNHLLLKSKHKIISVASCTTNCLVPMLKVFLDNFGIKKAMMTTVHAYTNDQELHDSPHKKPRRGRAGALNVIPTNTGASDAILEVLPELKDKINGMAVRVPVPCGSLTDLVVELNKKVDVKMVNGAFKKYSNTKMKGIIEYSEEDLVSSDVVGNAHSCVFDAQSTQINGSWVKVLGWYDNEFGYCNRLIDVVYLLEKASK